MNINGQKRTIQGVVMLIAVVALTWAAAAAQDTTVQGIIIGRSGANMVLKTADAPKLIVVMNDDTQAKEVEGKLGMRKKELGITALVPGLPVRVKGSYDAQNRLVASTVEFKASDLKTAQEIQAGLAPTDQELATAQQGVADNKAGVAANAQGVAANAQQAATNKQDIVQTNKRFSELDEYDTKGTVPVYFGNGSTVVEPQYKKQLMALSQQAMQLNGYMLQVQGFASSTGSAALNQKLSSERADAVLAYLEQDGKVPLTNILAPAAMGTSDQVASDATTEGQAQNRRVVVKILVNKAIAGS
jgi:outer membrane protein OmpA-like peptidoglycan-associated protein